MAFHFVIVCDAFPQDSQELGGSLNKEDGKAACEQLALSVFTNADEADRGGRVDRCVFVPRVVSRVNFA